MGWLGLRGLRGVNRERGCKGKGEEGGEEDVYIMM